MELKQPQPRATFNLDLRIIVVTLIVVIGLMLALWRPWQGTSERTIQVTGEATVKAEPDEFVFYPTYEFSSLDRQAAINNLTTKSEEVTAGLKKVGVTEKEIAVNSDGYEKLFAPVGDGTPTYTLRMTVTIGDKDLAQKVQDYLVSTQPTGAISPQATFSEAKRNKLEQAARDQATKDARAKAEQSAKNLGFRLGRVKAVSDGDSFAVPMAAERGSAIASDAMVSTAQLTIQPGMNELPYRVSVTYFVR